METEQEPFRQFVRQWWEPLTRTAYLLTGDRGTAEDLVQTALEKCHRRWSKIERTDAPVVYVRRALVNTATSWRRRRQVFEVPLTGSEPVRAADAFGRTDDRHELMVALRRLPPRTRAVLVLRYFEDLSEADTAAALGCSVGSVKSQASRGLARLREEFVPTSIPVSPRLQGDAA